MALLICFMLAVLLVTTIDAEISDKGPQTFKGLSTSPPQSSKQIQQKYKEVMMYLTPSQIRALESGQAVIESHPTAQPDISVESQKQRDLIQKQFQQSEQYSTQQKTLQQEYEEARIQQSAYIQSQQANDLEKHDTRTHIPIEEPNTEQMELGQKHEFQSYQPLSQNKQQQQHSQSFAYIHFYPPGQPQNDIKIQLYYPQTQQENQNEQILSNQEKSLEIQTDPLLQQKYQLIPYDYFSENKENQELGHKDFYEEIGHNLQENQNKEFFRPILQQPPLFKEPFLDQKDSLLDYKLQSESDLIGLQYASKYNDHKYASDAEKILNNIQLEKQLTGYQIEALAKSPPVLIHNSRRPIEVVKHVKIPVSAPFLVPVPEPFEVKVPQPYPVPLEIVRPIPIPIIKTEKVEIEKPVPIEIEKRIEIPVEKKIYVKVDKPYTVKKIVPIEIKKEIPVEIPIHKPEKLTILRHVWEH